MSEIRRFIQMRFAPKSDLIVMVVTFLLTVLIDLTIAVEIGVVLAVFLFIRRTTETSSIMPALDVPIADKGKWPSSVPKGIEIYEINGPFFFGTADFLQDVLTQVMKPPKVFILKLDNVPAIDATGLNALESFRGIVKETTDLILSGEICVERQCVTWV